MVASPRSALAALVLTLGAMGGATWLWPRAVGPTPAEAFVPPPAPGAIGLKVVRAGVFDLPVLGLDQLTARPANLPPPLLRASIDPSVLPLEPDDTEEEEMGSEGPGDPLRDALKTGDIQWPETNRSAKVDLDMSRLPEGLAEDDAPDAADDEGLLPPNHSEPLFRLSSVLAPPGADSPLDTFRHTRLDAVLAATMAERLVTPGLQAGGGDGAVPIDHSLAPVGGTSPAASRPDLAALDPRTTSMAAAPMELTAADPAETTAPITMAVVHPTPEHDVAAAAPALKPDEGLTEAQKNAMIAGLPGLDDGLARPMTLPPVAFTKAQVCMATAIYFEARGESEEGQIAVGQVIVNRVRSPFYPKNVCAVVYQGASRHRYGGCQFSFACDGVRDRITQAESWKTALDVAQRVLDAESWLPDLGNATHYHADYVRPRWVRDMVRKERIGHHIFYRVRGWA
jgi:spore germination cell wall hydrolase CwlJ-like protein